MPRIRRPVDDQAAAVSRVEPRRRGSAGRGQVRLEVRDRPAPEVRRSDLTVESELAELPRVRVGVVRVEPVRIGVASQGLDLDADPPHGGPCRDGQGGLVSARRRQFHAGAIEVTEPQRSHVVDDRHPAAEAGPAAAARVVLEHQLVQGVGWVGLAQVDSADADRLDRAVSDGVPHVGVEGQGLAAAAVGFGQHVTDDLVVARGDGPVRRSRAGQRLFGQVDLDRIVGVVVGAHGDRRRERGFELLVGTSAVAVGIGVEPGHADVRREHIEGDPRDLLLFGDVLALLVRQTCAIVDDQRHGRGKSQDRDRDQQLDQADPALTLLPAHHSRTIASVV